MSCLKIPLSQFKAGAHSIIEWQYFRGCVTGRCIAEVYTRRLLFRQNAWIYILWFLTIYNGSDFLQGFCAFYWQFNRGGHSVIYYGAPQNQRSIIAFNPQRVSLNACAFSIYGCGFSGRTDLFAGFSFQSNLVHHLKMNIKPKPHVPFSEPFQSESFGGNIFQL
jgi:hypothetical protein